MKLNLGLFGEFIPSWMDNNLFPKEEQIKIKYKRIVGSMASELIRFGIDQSMIFDNVAIVKKCVYEIENLFDVDGRKIINGDDLLKTVGVSGLVTEIGNHILIDSQMTVEEKKKDSNSIALDKRIQ